MVQPTGRELALRMHEIFNSGEFDAARSLFAPDFFSHPLQATGPNAVRERWTAMRAANPGLRTEVLDVVSEADRVAIRSRLQDGSGELFEFLRVHDGQIAELWGAATTADPRTDTA